MKKSILVLLLLLGTMSLFAQNYRLVTVRDIQFVTDSAMLAGGDPPSLINGDTVRVRGVVMVRPVVDPTTDRRRIVAAGARWHIYLQDQNGGPFSAIAVLQNDTVGTAQGTLFDLLDTAQVVELTGYVSEFTTTTQFNILTNPLSPVTVLNQLPKRPEPLELPMTEFMENGVLKRTAEKYEGMYVAIRNVFTSDRNTTSGTFKINDGQGNSMFMYDQSGFWTSRGHRLTGLTTYTVPLDGSGISMIRGVIQTRADGFYITPLYPGDIVVGATPPSVTSVRRDVPVVAPTNAVTVTAKIQDFDGRVASAKLRYRVNMAGSREIAMTKGTTDTTVYSAVIPAQPGDSSFVDYYIVATDNDNRTGTSPADTNRSRYTYFSLNRALTIKDVQYAPFGSGIGGYSGYRVTLSGIVTADTSDLPGYSSTAARVYMQDGSGPWTGIQVNGVQALNLKRGDKITAAGVIAESFDVTRIDSLTSLTVVSSNNPLPAATEVVTRGIGVQGTGAVEAEKYESVLITYKNLTVTKDNADGASGANASNFGEIFVADTSGVQTRVELQDGNHKYHNTWDSLLLRTPGLQQVRTGDKFSSITGVLFYSFSNWKLAPRKDADFTGYVSDVRQESNVPAAFSLSQNYPNPFNPATTITYGIEKAGMVTLDVFNVLGQKVRSLVNMDQAPGTYKVNFNAESLTSGVYYYTLKVGSMQQTRKMILMK